MKIELNSIINKGVKLHKKKLNRRYKTNDIISYQIFTSPAGITM